MTPEIFRSFVQHASGSPDMPNDYIATKLAALRMFPKLAMGLDSHAALAQSLYHHNGANEVARMALANPAHKSGLLGAVKSLAPAVGGVRTPGTNPLRAVASGMIHAKLASFVHPAADLAGLGMLGVPVAKTLRDPNASAKERSHAKWEAAGLGTLGAVSGHNLWQATRPAAQSAARLAAHI